jgi:hypothetical protein
MRVAGQRLERRLLGAVDRRALRTVEDEHVWDTDPGVACGVLRFVVEDVLPQVRA